MCYNRMNQSLRSFLEMSRFSTEREPANPFQISCPPNHAEVNFLGYQYMRIKTNPSEEWKRPNVALIVHRNQCSARLATARHEKRVGWYSPDDRIMFAIMVSPEMESVAGSTTALSPPTISDVRWQRARDCRDRSTNRATGRSNVMDPLRPSVLWASERSRG